MTYNYNKFKDLVEIILKKGEIIYYEYTGGVLRTSTRSKRTCKEMMQTEQANIANTQSFMKHQNQKINTTIYRHKDWREELQSYCNVGITAGPPKSYYQGGSYHVREEFWTNVGGVNKNDTQWEIVEVTIIGVKEDEIILNTGYKSDGIITQMSNKHNLMLTLQLVKEGTLRVPKYKVNDGEGQVLLSHKELQTRLTKGHTAYKNSSFSSYYCV